MAFPPFLPLLFCFFYPLFRGFFDRFFIYLFCVNLPYFSRNRNPYEKSPSKGRKCLEIRGCFWWKGVNFAEILARQAAKCYNIYNCDVEKASEKPDFKGQKNDFERRTRHEKNPTDFRTLDHSDLSGPACNRLCHLVSVEPRFKAEDPQWRLAFLPGH